MEIIQIVLAVVCAYVLFVSVGYLLIRLIFPKIEVNDAEEVPMKARVVNRYAQHQRVMRRQKNLAY